MTDFQVDNSTGQVIPPLSPQQQDERSSVGHMPNVGSDDDVDDLDQPFIQQDQLAEELKEMDSGLEIM